METEPEKTHDETTQNNNNNDEEEEEEEQQDYSTDTLLDLTSFQLSDLDSIKLPQNLTELDLTCNRLSSLDSRIRFLTNLKKLSLRQNLFDDSGVEPISSWESISGLEAGERGVLQDGRTR